MTEEEMEKATQELYAFIGEYVILFQLIEAKVEECLMLLWGHADIGRSRERLSNMNNKGKVDALWEDFCHNPSNARGRRRKDWVEKFEGLVEQLHVERRRRNTLLHSHYLFEFLEIGQPIMQIDKKDREEGQRLLSKDLQGAYLREIAQLAADMHFAHVQMVHDHED